jgi:hypothetical protein
MTLGGGRTGTGRARIASVDSCHQHASAFNISLPGEAHPDLQKQAHADSLLARANFGPTIGVHFSMREENDPRRGALTK